MDGRIAIEVEQPQRPSASSAGRMSQLGLLGLAASNGALLNGRKLESGEHLLQHGDIVEIAFGLVLRYFTHEQPRVRSPVLESAIGDEPDDDSRWRVYADWLLEQGDPLGARMSAGDDGGDDDARWLEAMARPWRSGNLELTWRHGFVKSATVRALEWEIAPDTYWCLLRLFELEVCRFVEGVQVDLFTTEIDRPPFELRAKRVLEHLRHAPRTLRSIRLGPVMDLDLSAELRRELKCLREERPCLETDEEALVHRFSRMVLRGEGGEVLELTPQDKVHRFGIESLTLTLGKYGVAWAERIEPRLAAPFLANGRPVWQARLMPGDVIEPAPGHKLMVEVS
jgi:uncharacterized protein (TIGR02996 family)